MGLKVGEQDPEQWLEDCPDRVYDQWQAFYRLEPWGGERELLARIVSLLWLIAVENRKSDEVSKVSEMIVNSLMPGDWIGQPETPDEQGSVETFESVVAKLWG